MLSSILHYKLSVSFHILDLPALSLMQTQATKRLLDALLTKKYKQSIFSLF